LVFTFCKDKPFLAENKINLTFSQKKIWKSVTMGAEENL